MIDSFIFPKMEDSAIEIRNLTKVYRRRELFGVKLLRGVEDISIDIRRGELFGLLGPNGSGKTTLIKIILGLLFPTKGEIKILGRSAMEHDSRKVIGYLPEVPYFYKQFSGREILKFYGQLSRVGSDKLEGAIQQVLETVRMKGHADRPMREYSKGMLQRIGLAQAMMHDPEVLLFDEPVTGLDPLGLREMRELILSLNRSGKTIFFSSHSISEVEKICHRVGIIVKGRLERVVEQKEWLQEKGLLEEIFVQTVSAHGYEGVA